MLSGLDAFSNQVEALMHQGPVRQEATKLPELLRDLGYVATCVGLGGNKSSRGFDAYIS